MTTHHPSVSLFSNCGAGDYGYRRAGFSFVVMAELLQKRMRVAELNHIDAEGVVGDLRETWPLVVEKYRAKSGGIAPSLLSACPPCQGLSTANNRRGKENDIEAGGRDHRNLLVLPIIEVTKQLMPKVVVVENVTAFLTRKIPNPTSGTATTAAHLLCDALHAEYVLYPFLCNLADYGVPQRRRRIFLTFVRRGLPGLKSFLVQRRAPYPRPTHSPQECGRMPISVGACFKSLNLPELDARTDESARGEHPLHLVPTWNAHHYAMVDAIPKGSGLSAWDNNVCASCGAVEAESTTAVCPDCGDRLLRPVVQEADGSYRLIKGFRASSYRRIDPTMPAPAVTTANGTIGSSSTIHPTENRVLSNLECCHLQTIPNEFRWWKLDTEKLEQHSIRKMIGEAVPPRFTEFHGNAIMGMLEENWNLSPISIFDQRCERARIKLGLPRNSNEILDN